MSQRNLLTRAIAGLAAAPLAPHTPPPLSREEARALAEALEAEILGAPQPCGPAEVGLDEALGRLLTKPAR